MIRSSLAVCLLLAAAPSCPDLFSIATHGFAVPTLEAVGATPAPDPQGLRLTIVFSAKNPNPFPLSVSGVDYQVSVQGEQVFAGSQAGLGISEHGEGSFNLAGVVAASSTVFRSLRPGMSSSYTVAGAAHVNTPAGVPVDVEFESTRGFIVPAGLPQFP
jgi:LEA14-like dessication related protein